MISEPIVSSDDLSHSTSTAGATLDGKKEKLVSGGSEKTSKQRNSISNKNPYRESDGVVLSDSSSSDDVTASRRITTGSLGLLLNHHHIHNSWERVVAVKNISNNYTYYVYIWWRMETDSFEYNDHITFINRSKLSADWYFYYLYIIGRIKNRDKWRKYHNVSCHVMLFHFNK